MSVYPEVYRRSTPKARKPYRCCECGTQIAQGETYVYVFGVWEGDPMKYRTCVDCDALREKLNAGRHGQEDWVLFEGLADEIEASREPEDMAALAAIYTKRGRGLPEWLAEEMEKSAQPMQTQNLPSKELTSPKDMDRVESGD